MGRIASWWLPAMWVVLGLVSTRGPGYSVQEAGWCDRGYWLPESVSRMVTSLISSSLGVLARVLSSRAGPRYSSRRGRQLPAPSSRPRYTSGLQGGRGS